MKNQIKNRLKILIYALLLLQSVFASAEPLLEDIKLSHEQETEYNRLTKLYAKQISDLFNLCTIGKHPKYKRQEPGEFEHLFKKSETSIVETIQNITKLYADVGISPEKIKEEETLLRAGIQNCLS